VVGELRDELVAVTTDETARQRIRPLVLRLGIWIGLDFEGYSKGKRPSRRLRRGVSACGQENLPVCVHRDRHVAVEDTVPAALPRRLAAQPVRRLDLVAAEHAAAAGEDHGASPDASHDNQGDPACCRGPVGGTRCLGRRWHGEQPHGRTHLSDGVVWYCK